MITIHAMSEGRVVDAAEVGKECWIDARSVTPKDLVELETRYGILAEHLLDIMDIDEQARIEKEDEYTLVVFRLPIYGGGGSDVLYHTVPVGLFLFHDRIATVCQSDCDVLEDLRMSRVRGISIKNKSAFALRLVGRSAIMFLRYLKDLNRRTAQIERDLQRSVKNNELIQLLTIEKSLVFFTTSLKSNEILLEKLQNSKLMRFGEDEEELLEDVLTDNRQAIEMANIHSDILSGMMDAFASVISNNLNIVMKRLMTVSIILGIATFVVSLFSMNVQVPFMDQPLGFAFIILLAFGASSFGAFFLFDRKTAVSPIRRKKSKKG